MSQIRAIIFDLDGTLVRYHGVEFESSWGAIAAAAGKQEESQRLLQEYLPRHDAYSEWVARDAALLTGVPVQTIADKVFPPPYSAGVLPAIAALRGRYTMGIISSGVDLVADRVLADLNLDFAVANRLLIEGNHFTGKSEMVVDLWRKADMVKRIAAERRLSLSEICFVGDHMNDAPVMRIVGLSVAFNPKDEALNQIADHVTDDFMTIPAVIERFRSI